MADEGKEDTPVKRDEEYGDEPAADVEAPADADAVEAPADADVEAPKAEEPAKEEEGGDEVPPPPPAEDGAEEGEEEKELSPVTLGVLGACAAMAALYLAAMAIWSGSVLTLAGAIAIIVGLIVSKVQYFDLESLETLRTVHNRLRASVNVFSSENTKLAANNDRLEEEIEPLKESEEKLSQIAERSGSDVKKLTGLVAENQETLDTMHELQQQDIVQSLMQILMDVDRNEDGELSDREVKRLMTRMKNLPTVKFNETNFERTLENHRGISSFLNIVSQVNDDDIPQDDRIFTINEEYSPADAMEEQF